MRHIHKTLDKYSKKDTMRLHMPGHKGRIYAFDTTEIPQTDDFNAPEGPYRDAMSLLSNAYLSHKSFFLTTGATTGIKAMVLYTKISGRKLIIARNSHMSVINACSIYGVEPIIIDPEYDLLTGTFKSPEKQFIDEIKNTDTKCACLITSPDYFGRCIDIGSIHKVATENESLIFVDEAHGAHYQFSKMLPDSCSSYADIWVNGAHKTLGALTQGAYLHCSKKIDNETLERIIPTINTSSPSHLIAETLENAWIEAKGGSWDIRSRECTSLQKKINSLKFIRCAGASWAKHVGYIDKDVCRVVIDAKSTGGGLYLYKELYNRFNIQLEMADFRYAVAIMTTYDDVTWDEKLFDALKELDRKRQSPVMPYIPKAGKKVMTITESWMKNVRYIDIDDCCGKVAASSIGSYPPGTALVLPGEMITFEHIKYFSDIKRLGGSVFGMRENRIAIVDI